MIAVVDNHSVRTDLLEGLPVLDAGCRGDRFGDWFRQKGHRVVGLDPAPDVEEGLKLALVGAQRAENHANLVMTADKEARHIGVGAGVLVETVTISELMAREHILNWDVVKLNIEGSEIEVLEAWPGAIARQVVVSFHLHTGRQTEPDVGRALRWMRQWYDVAQHVKEPRYGCGPNYWDTLLIRKGPA